MSLGDRRVFRFIKKVTFRGILAFDTLEKWGFQGQKSPPGERTSSQFS